MLPQPSRDVHQAHKKEERKAAASVQAHTLEPCRNGRALIKASERGSACALRICASLHSNGQLLLQSSTEAPTEPCVPCKVRSVDEKISTRRQWDDACVAVNLLAQSLSDRRTAG